VSDQPEPLHVDFHLLDRQIVDRDGAMIGNVDDVELDLDENGVPVVVALLVGQKALGQRLKGWLGRWMVATADRLSPDPRAVPLRIPYDRVLSVGSEIRLTVKQEVMPEPPMEGWLRIHLIERIPGGRRNESQ